MRVLHIDTGETWRGGQAQVFNLLKHMSTKTINHLLSPPDSELIQRVSNQLSSPHLHNHPLRGEWDLTAAWKIRSLHRNYQYDLIHAHSSHALGIAWVSSLLFDLPPFIETRRLETHVGGNFFSKRKYRATHHHIANSRTVKEALEESGINQDNITVVPSGIDLDKIDDSDPDPGILTEHNVDPEQFIIGNVGALSPQKDHDLFVEIAREIVEEFPEVQFVVAGEGKLRESLENKIRDYDLEDYVHLLGFIEDIFSLYKCFDLYVATARYEGLCGTLLQAMACEVPIITSNVRGSREILHHDENCRVVEVEDQAGFVKEIHDALNGNTALDQYINPARRTAEEFDYPQLAKQTRDLYQILKEN